MGAWCHGAGGIGLSRVLLIKEGYYDDKISEELNNAVSVLKKHLCQNHCVCHGDLGNLEIIKIISETIKDNKLSIFPDFGNDSPYLFTPMYEASFKGTKR